MSDRKPILLRLSPELHRELQRLAAEELRSVNGQIEFLLREAMRARGRQVGSRSREKETEG